MFGLGKINFAIKRYELAEKWFTEAYLKRRDMAYRVWLGFCYIQLFKLVPTSNKRKVKFAQYAVKNLGSRKYTNLLLLTSFLTRLPNRL